MRELIANARNVMLLVSRVMVATITHAILVLMGICLLMVNAGNSVEVHKPMTPFLGSVRMSALLHILKYIQNRHILVSLAAHRALSINTGMAPANPIVFGHSQKLK